MSVRHCYSEDSLLNLDDSIITEFEEVEDLENLDFCNDRNNDIGLDVIAIYRLKTDDAEFMLTFSRLIVHDGIIDVDVVFNKN